MSTDMPRHFDKTIYIAESKTLLKSPWRIMQKKKIDLSFISFGANLEQVINKELPGITTC